MNASSILFQTSQPQPIRGDWYCLPCFPDVTTRRPSHYELFYRGRVMAIVEPNQRVLDLVLERAKGVLACDTCRHFEFEHSDEPDYDFNGERYVEGPRACTVAGCVCEGGFWV